MIVKREDMQNSAIRDTFRRFFSSYRDPGASLRSEGLSGVRVATATADQLFDEYRANNIDGHYAKGIRPWEMIDFRQDKHPDADLMIGVEVECGFSTEKKLRTAYTYLMDECDYATGDVEGAGNWPLEATFPPVPSDQLLAEGCQLRGFYENVLSKQSEFWSARGMVGTHFNVSWPSMSVPKLSHRLQEVCDAIYSDEDYGGDEYCCESCNGDYDAWIEERKSAVSSRLGKDETKKLFGRKPYGLLYYQSARDSEWVEMKLFNSTTDINKLLWYKQVAIEIAAWLRIDTGVTALEMLEELASRSPLSNNGKLRKLPEVKSPRARKAGEVKRAAAR